MREEKKVKIFVYHEKWVQYVQICYIKEQPYNHVIYINKIWVNYYKKHSKHLKYFPWEIM